MSTALCLLSKRLLSIRLGSRRTRDLLPAPFLVLLLALGSVHGSVHAAAQTPPFAQPLADLAEGVSTESSEPRPAYFETFYPYDEVDPDGSYFFWADDGVHGSELWTSDGTEAGLRLLADFCPGPCSSTDEIGFPSMVRTSLPGRPLLVVADDGATGPQVWRVDDDESEYRRLTSMCADFATCEPKIYLSGASLDDGRVLFAVQAAEGDTGAWVSDGTPEGTERLWDSVTDAPRNFLHFFRVGDWIVFPSYTPDLGAEWFRTDGAGSPPELIEEVCPGECPTAGATPRQLDDRVIFFWLDEVSREWQAWGTDGTPEGTESLRPACRDACPTGPGSMVVVDGRGFFFTDASLWTTDGTVAGTVRRADLPRKISFLPHNIAEIGDSHGVLLVDEDFVSGLWRIDGLFGPEPKFVHLGDLADRNASLASTGDRLLVLGGMDDGADLWVSDGTVAGTQPLAFDPPLDGQFLAAVGGQFFFTADSPSGRELWVSDGTMAGTRQAHDLLGDPAGSNPANFVRVGDRVVFTTESFNSLSRYATSRHQLWSTRGDATSSQPLVPANPDGLDPFAAIQDLTALGDVAVFEANTGDGFQIWVTDATAEGTRSLGDLNPDDRPHLRSPVRLGEQIVFAAEQGIGQKLWISDGTPEGTRVLIDIDPEWENNWYGCGVCSPPGPPGPIFPRGLTKLGDQAVFAAVTDEHGAEPWITDGTAEGTRRLADLVPGSGWSEPTNFTRAGDLVYFLATDASRDPVELWTTDGTQPGTRRITVLEDVSWRRDLHVEDPRFDAAGFADGSHRLALAYNAGGEHSRLWIAEPEPKVYDYLWPGSVGELTPRGSWLYYTVARDSGVQLTATGGPAGTTPSTVVFGPQNGGARQLAAFRDGVFFAARGETGGHELWHIESAADGMPRGLPKPVVDLRPGNVAAGTLPASSSPDELTVIDSGDSETLYFSADDGIIGREPWTLDVAALPDDEVPCEPDHTTACVGDRFRLRAYFRTTPDAPELPAKTVTVGDGAVTDTAFFTFFGTDNLELAVKVIDGTPINEARWVFYGALSDVEYRVVVDDLAFARTRTYGNPAGEYCGQADVDAFPNPQPPIPQPGIVHRPPSDRASTPRPHAGRAEKATCDDGPSTLCLHDRFEVRVDWRTEADGEVQAGQGTAIPYSTESGVFWFFGEANTELVVKLLDGRTINDRWWFFYGALSDVEYEIRVVDRETGAEKIYRNEPGNLCGDADVEAFGP